MLVAVLGGDHKSLELFHDLVSHHGAEDTDDEENDEDVEDRHNVELEGVREYTQQSLFLVFLVGGVSDPLGAARHHDGHH